MAGVKGIIFNHGWTRMGTDFLIKPSTISFQLSTIIRANLAKLLHKQDFRDGL